MMADLPLFGPRSTTASPIHHGGPDPCTPPWTWESWPPQHGPRGADPTPHLRGAVPVVQTDQLSYSPAPHLGPWVGPA